MGCKITMYSVKNNECGELNGESFVNGTSDREAHPKYWIAVLVQMNTEQKSSTKLTKLGITNYVPTQSEIHQWSDRKKKIERIVIPMIVFVKVDKEITPDFIIMSDYPFFQYTIIAFRLFFVNEIRNFFIIIYY